MDRQQSLYENPSWNSIDTSNDYQNNGQWGLKNSPKSQNPTANWQQSLDSKYDNYRDTKSTNDNAKHFSKIQRVAKSQTGNPRQKSNRMNQIMEKSNKGTFSRNFNTHKVGIENRRKTFTFNNGRPKNNLKKSIRFEDMRSENDLKMFNRQQSRATTFSLKTSSPSKLVGIDNTASVPQNESPQLDVSSKQYAQNEYTKMQSGMQGGQPIKEIIIETTISPTTTTKSFIQFLKEVLEQREMVKSKMEVSQTEIEKTKQDVPPTTLPAPSSTKSTTTRAKTTVPPSTSASTSATPLPTTTKPSTTSPTTTTTTMKTTAKTTVTAPITTTKHKVTTDANRDQNPRTLRSLLANLVKRTTVKIKALPSTGGSQPRETTVKYTTPKPKSTSPGTTTIKYANSQRSSAADIVEIDPLSTDAKQPRIKIRTEATTPSVVTSSISSGSMTSHIDHSDVINKGTTGSSIQSMDRATQRSDVVDQMINASMDNVPTKSTTVPASSEPRLYESTGVHSATSNVDVKGAEPAYHVPNPQDTLPENATFLERIIYLKRQMEVRQNPLAALQKYGNPSSNMFHLIKLLPKNNHNPMAAKNVAQLFTMKTRPVPETTTTLFPPSTSTTATTTTTTERPTLPTGATEFSFFEYPVLNTKESSKTKSKKQKPAAKQKPATKNTKKKPQKGRKPPVKPAKKKKFKQCFYSGKVYKIGKRFRNSKGQRCRCQRNGRVKCRK
jgi:hypothetical protein